MLQRKACLHLNPGVLAYRSPWSCKLAFSPTLFLTPLPDPGHLLHSQLASLQGIFQGHICCSVAISLGSSACGCFQSVREGLSWPPNGLFPSGSRNEAPVGRDGCKGMKGKNPYREQMNPYPGVASSRVMCWLSSAGPSSSTTFITVLGFCD